MTSEGRTMHWGFALSWVGGVLLWAVAGAARDFRAEVKAYRGRAKEHGTNEPNLERSVSSE